MNEQSEIPETKFDYKCNFQKFDRVWLLNFILDWKRNLSISKYYFFQGMVNLSIGEECNYFHVMWFDVER